VLIAVLDACVLYPAPLRDLLMRVAATEIYQARWTDQIHGEWMRSVLEDRPDLTREQLERTRELMNSAIPDCLVSEYEVLIEGLSLPDPDDRHVLAAAIRCEAQLIVTSNLRDFPAKVLSANDVEARHPDPFLSNLIELYPTEVTVAALGQWRSLRNPPKTRDEFLGSLERQGLTMTVASLRVLLPWEK
jgi:hypothetical protein